MVHKGLKRMVRRATGRGRRRRKKAAAGPAMAGTARGAFEAGKRKKKGASARRVLQALSPGARRATTSRREPAGGVASNWKSRLAGTPTRGLRRKKKTARRTATMKPFSRSRSLAARRTARGRQAR